METTGSDRWNNDILRALSQNGASRVSQNGASRVSQNGASRVSQTVANIATAIKYRMRRDSGQKIQGNGIALESYIHVRWL